MAISIDRVNFYERQYLRAFDLLAEQAYHLEMRRRLNLALHLWGIVDGFDVAKGAPVLGAPEQFIISPGMAIDGYGREIMMAQPYALSNEDVRRNRITGPLDCWLAIAYRNELTTPPSPGLRLCDLDDQFTRLHETFTVLILQEKPAPAPVGVADSLSDDPINEPWPVILGKVHVTLSGDIDAGWLQDRVYVGSRTERLVAPMASLSPAAIDYSHPIRIEAHAFAQKNLAVGEDFSVDNGKVVPSPPSTIPTGSGNVKVGTDLFVKGEIYKYHSGRQQWLALKEQLAQLMPDMQMPAAPNPRTVITAINSASVQPSTGILPISVTTKLLSPSKADLFVALAGVTWLSHTQEGQWLTALGAAVGGNTAAIEASLKVLPNPVKTNLSTGTQYDFQVQWTVGPTVQTAPQLPIVALQVSCFGIFLP